MIGERMTWNEMAEQYPDQWVAVKDAVKDGPDIVSGVLVAVKSDDEIIPYKVANYKKGYIFQRTTEGDFNGIISTDFSISVD